MHPPQQLPGFFRLVDVAGIKRPSLIGRFTQSLVELELDDEADKVPGARSLTPHFYHELADFYGNTTTLIFHFDCNYQHLPRSRSNALITDCQILIVFLPDVRHVGGDVELCTWVEVVLSARHRRAQTLVLQPATTYSLVMVYNLINPSNPHDELSSYCPQTCKLDSPQVPPLFVVLVGRDAPVKHLPPPLVNQVAKGQEGDLVERHAHQEVDVALWRENIASP